MTADLEAFLEPLGDVRRQRVLAWLTEDRTCVICAEAIERHDATQDTGAGIAHVRCASPLLSAR